MPPAHQQTNTGLTVPRCPGGYPVGLPVSGLVSSQAPVKGEVPQPALRPREHEQRDGGHGRRGPVGQSQAGQVRNTSVQVVLIRK